MADRYEKISKALGMGQTPGSWSVRYDYVVQAKSFDKGRLVPIAHPMRMLYATPTLTQR